MNALEKFSSLLQLKFLGLLITLIIILVWIGIWAVICFLATQAGDHLLAEWSTFRIIAFNISGMGFAVFHVFSALSELSTLHWRLLWLGYNLVRWPYFVLLLLSENTLVQDFAFAFEFTVVPAVGILIGLGFGIFYCFIGIEKEISTWQSAGKK